MLGGSTGARAPASTVSSQGAFMGTFDSDMVDCRPIGGKTKLQQFNLFQQALSNAMSKFCNNLLEDVKALFNNLEEVNMDKLAMPDESLMSGTQGQMHMSNYKDDMKDWKAKVRHYTSNKSAMCSAVLGQCDPAMHARLQMTENWEANKMDLLYVLKAAQAACIGVQENFSMHIVGCEAMRSLANSFQTTDTPLTFK